jgi:hypothetical protein
MRQRVSPTDTGQTSLMEHPELEDLAAYIEGKLSPSERNRIAGHLASCEDCYEVFTETIRALEEDAPGEQARAGGGLARFPFDRLPWIRRRSSSAELDALLVEQRPAVGQGWIAAGAVAAVLALGLGWVSYRELIAPPAITTSGITADLGAARGLTRWIWTGDVQRGGETGYSSDQLSARSFQIGALEVALKVSFDTGDLKRAAELCRQIGNVLDVADDQGGRAEQFWQARTALESGKASSRLYQDLAGTLAVVEDDELSRLYLQFGRWAEAARLAALAGREDFFDSRANRRFLKLLQQDPARLENPDLLDKGQPIPIHPDVKQHLQSIASVLDVGVHGEAERKRIRDSLDDILRFYFSPQSDELPELTE